MKDINLSLDFKNFQFLTGVRNIVSEVVKA